MPNEQPAAGNERHGQVAGWDENAAIIGPTIARRQVGPMLPARLGLGTWPPTAVNGPKDMAATIYHLLGVVPETVIREPDGRPHPLVIGQPIEDILSRIVVLALIGQRQSHAPTSVLSRRWRR